MVRQKREWLAYVGRPVSYKKLVSSLTYREAGFGKNTDRGRGSEKSILQAFSLGCINIGFRMLTCDKCVHMRCI